MTPVDTCSGSSQPGWRWIRLVGLYWVPLVVYATVIYYLSSLSHPEVFAPSVFEVVSDKLLHAMEYGVLGILCYRAFRYATRPSLARYAVLLAIAVSAFYGLTDELHQGLVPGREADVGDLLADVAGASLTVWVWHRLAHGMVGRNGVRAVNTSG
jgi:VanZ family protein